MKKVLTTSSFVVIALMAVGQSNSYQSMKNTFIGGDDVHAFSVNGVFARAIFRMADEHAFSEAITDVKSIKLITIPKNEFGLKGVSVPGFKKLLKEDSFQELADFRDKGDYVTFFHQKNGRGNDCYFILVEDEDDVIGIEMKGSINMNALMNLQKKVAYKG